MNIFKQKNNGEYERESKHFHRSPRYSKRKELYDIIERYADCNREIIAKIYNNLYEIYLIQTKNNLTRLSQTAGYTRVVEYAEAFGHIDGLLRIAKFLYVCGEKEKHEEENKKDQAEELRKEFAR